MDATEKDFTSPIIDFFGRRDRKPEFGVTRIGGIGENYSNLEVFYGSLGYSQLYARELVDAVSPNDIGGITMHFSEFVMYKGSSGGGHGLAITKHLIYEKTDKYGNNGSREPHFSYDHIARVRKPNGEVVWENADVPAGKKVLKEKPVK